MKTLRIVSFTIPYPADYGGVIDIWYRLQALHNAGVPVELHCFQYDRKPALELEKICSKVFYYPRKNGLLNLLSSDPFITVTRNSKSLQQHIASSDDPLWMEGIHSTQLLQQGIPHIKHAAVRIHNIEHHYYQHLAAAESNALRKAYFKSEAKKLATFESVYGKASALACISETETSYYRELYGDKAFHLPAFHPYNDITPSKGKGDFVLYHGNLSIAENHKAAMFLITEVAAKGGFPLIIAGRNPRPELKREIVHHSNIKLLSNPTGQQMEQLIAAAHVHALPTFQDTGVKLKLLAALFSGRHVVTNPAMVKGTGLESLCKLATTAIEFRETIHELLGKPLSSSQLDERKEVLMKHYNNAINAELLIRKMEL